MLSQDLFKQLQQITKKPKPYGIYTTPDLWCDPYISKQMLALHTSDDVALASRKKEFIDKSAAWIIDHFAINSDSKICDFGCGPGLYTSRFAKYSNFVTGIDFSKTSINYAKEQTSKNNQKIEYILQDYLKFETSKKFNLITMIYCDFCVLNSDQRKILLKKFYDYLEDDGKILLDVSSYVQYNAREESCTFEYSEKDGFWSKDPYYVFHNHFKYENEHLFLDKFTIIEESRIRENYNWMQCYTLETITKEFEQNGLQVIEHYSNVAGEKPNASATEIAIIAEKK